MRRRVALGHASFALANARPVVAVCRAVSWIARGGKKPSRDSLLAGSVDRAHLGKAIGLERAMDSVGAVIEPLLAAPLQIAVGYRWLFAVSACLGLCFRCRRRPVPVPSFCWPFAFERGVMLAGRYQSGLAGARRWRQCGSGESTGVRWVDESECSGGCWLSVGEPAVEGGGGDWFAEVVALAGVAAGGAEHVPADLVFDAFGDDVEFEVGAEVDDGADDFGVVLVGAHPDDE